MEYCELSKEEQERRKTIAEHTRSMIPVSYTHLDVYKRQH